MRRILYIFFLLMVMPTAISQKLVIGSEIPDFRSLRNEIAWMTTSPEPGPMLIDFYQPYNPTCVDNLERLSKIAESMHDKLSVVIFTKDPDYKLKAMAGKVYVAVDTTGNGFFERCYVQYLPYTILVDVKNRLLWHGILNTLSDDMLVEKLH